MFVPPEQRRSWEPPQPGGQKKSRRGEAVLLFLIAMFLLSMLLGPIGGSTVLQALQALLNR